LLVEGKLVFRDGTILVLEDDDVDFLFLQRALKAAGGSNPVQQVATGEEAIGYISGLGRFADRERFPFPTMFLTDCKTAGLSGLEVMRWMKEHPQWRVVPTVFLTGNDFPADVREAYDLGAQAVMVKPLTPEDLKCCIKCLYEFWQRCAQCASKNS
jgi:CheY-like chemotaxis protein